MDDTDYAPFVIPHADTHPAIIAERLMLLPEHSHLKEYDVRVEWLLRTIPKVKAGRQVLGTCYTPMVQGDLRDMFIWLVERLFGQFPDFLIILDRDYWIESTPLQREILVYHEMSHAKQALDKYGAPRFDKDGNPVWSIRGHDVEEFTDVVARYGAWNEELRAFIAAARDAE